MLAQIDSILELGMQFAKEQGFAALVCIIMFVVMVKHNRRTSRNLDVMAASQLNYQLITLALQMREVPQLTDCHDLASRLNSLHALFEQVDCNMKTTMNELTREGKT